MKHSDVAAYGNLFFYNRPSEVMKSKRTIYRKTSHKIKQVLGEAVLLHYAA